MNLIFGKDTIISVLVEDTYYPILCGSDLSLHVEQEMIEKTGINSPGFREYVPRLSLWTASVSGATPISNDTVASFFYMLLQSVRTAKQTIKFTFTDQGGSVTSVSGDCYVSSNDINGNVSQFSQASLNFQGTGALNTDPIAPPSNNYDILADKWDTSNGESFVSGASAINGYSLASTDTVLLVAVEGTEYDIVSSTPGSRQVQFITSPSVKLQFASDLVFDGSQKVLVMFKRPI